jgi:hypothetical protein
VRKNLFGLSPATRNLIRELWLKPTSREQWTNDERTLGLIEEIRIAKEPATVGELMPLGFSDQDSIRRAARATIKELVALVPLDFLPLLDESLRRPSHYLGDWHGLRPERVCCFPVRSHDDAVFMRLVASHRSGYVRAEALKLFESDLSAEALPFVLLRLVDWVDAVRSAAESQVRQRLQPEYADSFVASLHLVDRLMASTRFSRVIADSIREFLCSLKCAEAVRRGLNSTQHSLRRTCFRLSLANPAFSPREVPEKAVPIRTF